MELANLAADPLIWVPVCIWTTVHCVMPDDGARVAEMGLRLGDAYNRRRLLLHSLAHGNVHHLLNNAVVHVFAAANFRVPRELQWYTSRLMLGGLVMAAGVGVGVFALVVDADRERAHNEEQFGLGIGVVKTVVGALTSAVTNQRVICGASAGIAALHGYNAAMQSTVTRAALSSLVIAQDVYAVMQEPHPHPLQYFGFGAGGPLVANIAHIAGFAAGAAIGVVVNRMAQWRQQQVQYGAGRRLGGR